MNCRICGSESPAKLGDVEYYSGFAWSVYDCAACGCRFTKHDDSIYEWLHKQPESIYRVYRDLVATAKQLFEERDLQGLKRQLSQTAKYRFIIESIEGRPKNIR